jgi:radical SAM superfamily enzyme YgiQ (UPF0313 family)
MSTEPSRQNVYLIDPGTDSNLNLLPLGIGRIASYCRSLEKISKAFNCQVRWLRKPATVLADSLKNPVVVGLPCYVWNTQASLELARAIRARHPNCLIVVGGASIPKRDASIKTFLADNPYIDVLVRGDGEVIFADILEALIDKRDLADVGGIAIADPDKPGGILISPPKPWIKDLDIIPSPFLDGIFDGLMDLHHDRVTGVVLESNRGCPYSCTFCDWGSADLHKIKTFDLQRVKDEIDWVGKNAIPYIFLADANFGILYERDLDLADHIAKTCERYGFPKFLGINWAKNSNNHVVEIAERLLSGGVNAGVTLAAQSFHDPTLEAINRRNMKQEDINKMRKLFHSKGIVTYTDLIVGLPEETLESFLGGLEMVMTPDLNDHWVIHLCNILENSEMSEPEYLSRYRIETRTCAVTMTLRIHDTDSVKENEIIVIATSTLPRTDWGRAYDVGYLCAALHNFRLAFFVMNLLKARFGINHTTFISYFLDTVREQPGRWPVLQRGVEHLGRQRQMIVDGVARYSPVKELGDFNASPQEALLAMFLEVADQFYDELRDLTQCLLEAHDKELPPDLMAELFDYQRLRMTVWQPAATLHRDLCYDLPTYFDQLQQGTTVDMPTKKTCQIDVIVPENDATDKFDHARRRTRGARYSDILDVRAT